MRYEPDHKLRTRERLLAEAAQAIRSEGAARLGVAHIMARAGLTHGGFYAHFGSKEEFVSAALGHMFEEGRRRQLATMSGLGPLQALNAYVAFYLSADHRDARVAGCPLPFLSAEAPHLAPEARARYASGAAHLATCLEDLFARLGRADPAAAAAAMLAEMVGAVALARAEPDAGRSEAILAHSRQAVRDRFGLEASA